MSLPQPRVQRTFLDAAAMVDGLFGKTDRYRLFREKVLPALDAKRRELAALYCEDNGRPAIEPVVALGVTLLQFMERVPDRKAAENVRLHLGWKYALDLTLDDNGFHHTSLVKFRDRLLGGDLERIGFDAILDALRQAGLVQRRSRQRLDSTHILGCVSRMSRLECIRETLRLFLRQVKRWDLQGELPGAQLLVERYCESQVQWFRLDKKVLGQKAIQAGEDAWSLICWLRQQAATIRDHQTSALLERVFADQYELDLQQAPVLKRRTSGAVQNPHDPEAQWTCKDLARAKNWVGYKLQIAETVPEQDQAKPKGTPTRQFIAEATTTEALVSDLEGMRRNLRAQAEHQADVPSEMYADTAYVSDDTLAQAKAEGRELIGPAHKPGNPGGGNFDTTHFDVDTVSRTAICPAGYKSRQCSLINDHHMGSAYLRFEWASLCDACTLQPQCTKRRDGRRHLSVGIHHDLLQKRRREMQTEAFKLKMRRRNAIEGTISEYVRAGGRRARYRGLSKTSQANYCLAAAINVRRWIRLLQWEYQHAATAT